MAVIGKLALQHGGYFKLDNALISALEWLSKRVVLAVPRSIGLPDTRKPILLFVDGACEGSPDDPRFATIGGVLLDYETSNFRYFGAVVPKTVSDDWTSLGKLQVISQTEMYAAVLARCMWRRLFCNRMTIMFIDNDGVRENLVKGYSEAVQNLPMLMRFAECDLSFPSQFWFTRVQTHANLADGPSRDFFDDVRSIKGMVGEQADHSCLNLVDNDISALALR